MLKKLLSLAIILTAGHFASAETPTEEPLTNAQIGKVLMTINEGEIDAAGIAARHAQRTDIKDFAKMMAADHKKNKAETASLEKKMKGKTDSTLATNLKEDAKKSNADLKSADKTSFDKAYVDQQIAMHEKALATLKETLIPNATDADLKSHLERTQAAVTQHYEHAKKLQVQ